MRLLRSAMVAASLALAAADGLAVAADPLGTIAERSGFLRTGRYDEVVALCAAFQRVHPRAVRCVEFGRTPEGRAMLAIVATHTGALSAETARRRGIPVLLVQGGIHAGEIDGKDAGFLALRELLEGRAARGALARQVVILVPVFNVDGHERFGRWNRPNERGPEEMGWRTTAQNFNLNRDYAKADTREMQAMLHLVDEWDPLACIDLHVTDGAKFEHDVAIQVEPLHAGDPALQKAGRALRDAVIADLAARGSLPLPFYPSFAVDDDPASGITDGVSPPRFSTGYFLLRNRFGMLVETHSWKDYPARVRVTRNAIVSVVEQIAAHGGEWLATAREADLRAARLGGEPVPQSFKAGDRVRIIDFRGYAYTRTMSDVSGALMTRYDESAPEIWKIPVRDELLPELTITAPRGGYLVPAAYAARVAGKLRQHGIATRVLASRLEAAAVETFRAGKANFSARSTEGHQRLALRGEWTPEMRSVDAGALFVPIAQPKARRVMALLEPLATDSLAAWGEFNIAFEQKEYMEPYVAEEVAREQLAADPALAEEFRRRLAAEPEFAASPAARLEFFYRRHPSWDERLNLYPVMRTGAVPP